MSKVLTSEAFGGQPGDTVTKTTAEEKWLVENGYARVEPQSTVDLGDQYEVQPGEDLTSSANREEPNDAAGVANAYAYGAGLEARPDVDSLTPNTGAAAGGTVVTIAGNDLTGVTSVTFGGSAGTALDVNDDDELLVTTPAHAAGAVNVVLTNASGSTTVTGGFTYA